MSTDKYDQEKGFISLTQSLKQVERLVVCRLFLDSITRVSPNPWTSFLQTSHNFQFQFSFLIHYRSLLP